ncbi:MAG: ABC transporter permease [Clostridia bacterium]|nr:ABC transporter permease [Clostridia bacterium]
MKLRHVWAVFKKEAKDIIRDKKTLIASIIVPMLLIPVINIFIGGGIEKLQKDIKENVTIALGEKSNTPEIKALVENEIIKDIKNIKLIDVDKPMEALKEEKVRLLLDIEKDFDKKLKNKKPFTIKVTYDKSKAKSDGGLDEIKKVIAGFNNRILTDRITEMRLTEEFIQPSKLEENNIADESKTSTSMLAMFLPFLVVILIASGGIQAATDLVAGEKERNTFEPLLTTQPARSSILAGKYLTVTLFSFITVLATLTGIIIGYLINPNSLSMGSGQEISGFSVDPLAFILSILITLLLGATFSGIQIALSTYAKSFKEAQTYLSFLIIAAMLLAYSNMFTQPSDLGLVSFLVPVLNAISSLKMVLGGTINYMYLGAAIGSSIIFVIISTAIATAMFKNEKVLFRS